MSSKKTYVIESDACGAGYGVFSEVRIGSITRQEWLATFWLRSDAEQYRNWKLAEQARANNKSERGYRP